MVKIIICSTNENRIHRLHETTGMDKKLIFFQKFTETKADESHIDVIRCDLKLYLETIFAVLCCFCVLMVRNHNRNHAIKW